MTVLSENITGYQIKAEAMETGHIVIGDEPPYMGGDGVGPSPVAFLEMSLANCTVVTIAGIARERNIPIDGVKVRVVSKPNIQVKGPHDPKQRQLRMVELRRYIEVKGDITEEQANTLLWGANNCPVSNTIKNGVSINTKFKVIE